MWKYFQFYFFVLTFVISGSLVMAGCTEISLTKKSKHNLLPETANNQQISAASQEGKIIDLSGQWAMGFRLNGVTTAGTMWLKQSGQNFSGFGKDSENGPAYKIERGTVKANEIIFLKRYSNDLSPPVQYHGQFSYLSGDNGQMPYMGGNFSREANGNVITGDWEALQNQPSNTRVAKNQLPPAISEAKDNQAVMPSHVPDLSGKWQMAFEYNFKITHSIMFLEQDGKKLNGHGIDKDTNSQFIIKKGWYNFPQIGFTREYVPSPKAKHAVPIREMTFRADVTLVNDKDYQGPYLSGKTQGGGSWEGERVN